VLLLKTLGVGVVEVVFPSEKQVLASGDPFATYRFTERGEARDRSARKKCQRPAFSDVLTARSRSRKNVFFREFAASVAENVTT
jgi:hypothetical protein